VSKKILGRGKDGTQAEAIYDFVQTTSGECGGLGCPNFVEGVMFDSSTGDLYFEGASDGIWKIPGISRVPFGGPFPLPVSVLTLAQLGADDHPGLAFDNKGDLLISSYFTGNVLISSPPFTSASVLISDTGAGALEPPLPLALAVDPSGNIFVSNNGLSTGNVACFSSSGTFETIYADFGPTNDFPIGIQLDASGNLFVVTENVVVLGDSKLWKITPATTPICNAPGIMTLVVDLGTVSDVPGLLSTGAEGVAIPTLTSPPQTIVPGTVQTFTFPTYNAQIGYPAGAVIPAGTQIFVNAQPSTQANFSATRLAGSQILSQFPNTQCILYPAATGAGSCVVFRVGCLDSEANATPCPMTPAPNIQVLTTFQNPAAPILNPGLLTATDNENDWVNIFQSIFIDAVVIKGGTDGFNSDFVAVDLGLPPGAQLATFTGFQSPLAPKNQHIFSPGETIAVKFQLVNASGQFVTNATAKLSVVYLGPPQAPQPVSLANMKGIAPNQFAYNSKSNAYQFYLSTVGYAPGEYSLTVFGGVFPTQTVTFTIQ
jgi:hypothetical protein